MRVSDLKLVSAPRPEGSVPDNAALLAERILRRVRTVSSAGSVPLIAVPLMSKALHIDHSYSY